MIRLFTIEWLKLKSYRTFWILSGLYVAVLVVLGSGGRLFLQYLANKGVKFQNIDPTIVPLYDFPDVWQNLIYIATFFKIFPAFIIIISVCNEYSYKTVRQNVIDGLSKQEFIASKLILMLILSLVNVLIVWLIGLFNGLAYSSIISAETVFSSFDFVAAYFLELVTFFSFAMLMAMLIKRAGFAIVILMLYNFFIEPVAWLILSERYPLLGFYNFFPIRAINNLITVPFPRYVFMEIQDYVAWVDASIVGVYLLVFLGLSYWLMRAKDLG